MSKHIETRRLIKEIPEIGKFNELLNRSTLSEEDKTIMYLHYIEDKDFNYIADKLGYSENWIKKKHCKMLNKLSKLI